MKLQLTLTIPLLAAALLVGASGAHAEMKPVARAGVWIAFAGTANDTGKPMCMMGSYPDIRSVVVKWIVGTDGLYVHVGKDNWNVPLDVEVPLAISFDQETPFKGTAKRYGHFAPKWIELHIKDTDARRFMDQFATADGMRVSFSGGSEGDWVMRMDGSDTIARKYTECVAALKKKMGPATQPFSQERSSTEKKKPLSNDDPI